MKPLGVIKLRLSRHRQIVCTAAALVTGVAVCAWKGASERRNDETSHNPPKLPAPVVDALAGALGEVAQISVLYPLDTIKVGVNLLGDW